MPGFTLLNIALITVGVCLLATGITQMNDGVVLGFFLTVAGAAIMTSGLWPLRERKK